MMELWHWVLIFFLSTRSMGAHYPANSLIPHLQQQHSPLHSQSNTHSNDYSSRVLSKEASERSYSNEGRQQYTYGQLSPFQAEQSQSTLQLQQSQQNLQRNPSGGYTTNSNQFRTGDSNTPSGKLEQQLKAQTQPHQQVQQQRYNQERYSPGGYNNGDGGVNVQVQLKSYANPERKITGDKMCTCPSGNYDCVNKNPSRAGFFCLFAFTVVIVSEDTVIHKQSTPYLLFNANGQLSQEYLSSFQRMMDFQLESEPTSINVFVNNLGPVFDASGNIEEVNTVSDVDTFVKQLRESTAGSSSGSSYNNVNIITGSIKSNSGSNQQLKQANLIGTQLGTQLSLTYTISCRGRLIGSGCDLSCNKSAVNSDTAICVSAKTGYFSLCRWTNGNSQVSECKNCPWGIEDNAYCRDENGGVLEANHAGVVSEEYQIAAIILAISCGLLTFCLVATCVYLCARIPRKGKKLTKSRTPPAYNTPTNSSATSYLKHGGKAEALMDNATNDAQQPLRSNHAGQHYLPPLPNGKAKSLRSPLLYPMPPQHLLNDTMNSSFTGSQAPNAPLSVSADV